MSLPFTSFFSDELNFEKERVTPKEGKATALPHSRASSAASLDRLGRSHSPRRRRRP